MSLNEQLIQRLDQSREQIRAALADYPTDREIYSPWKIKEMLSHLTGWDDAAIDFIKSMIEGTPHQTPARRGIDYYNEMTVSERSTLSLEHIRREWEVTRQELRKLILELPEARLTEIAVLPWGPKGSVSDFVEILEEHDIEHAHDVNRLKRGIAAGS